LIANEDYEFNSRLRASGGRIWIDPLIRAVYFSRPTLNALANQYFSYGFWKVKMLQLHPKTLRWRQALPPIFVFGILMLLLLSVFSFLARLFLLIGFGSYLLVLMAAAVQIAVKRSDGLFILGIPAAIMTMHFSWGSGFWWSLINKGKKGN
jgi:succinoglycan biosynthesis protein ExoA